MSWTRAFPALFAEAQADAEVTDGQHKAVCGAPASGVPSGAPMLQLAKTAKTAPDDLRSR